MLSTLTAIIHITFGNQVLDFYHSAPDSVGYRSVATAALYGDDTVLEGRYNVTTLPDPEFQFIDQMVRSKFKESSEGFLFVGTSI